MTNKAHVTISRISSNMEDDYISLRVEDDISGVIVTDVKMSLSEFAKCVTSQGHCPGEFTLIPTSEIASRFGKKREVKTVKLPWKKLHGDVETLKELIQPHLVDGWQTRGLGLSQQQPPDGHNVTLVRWVECDGGSDDG